MRANKNFVRTSYLVQLFILLVLSILIGLLCTQKATDPFNGFKIGVQSYSLRAFPVWKAVEDVHELGLNYVEVYPGHFPVSSSAASKDSLRELLKNTNVQFVAYGVCNFNSDENIARDYFEFAKEMDFDILVVNPKKEELDFIENLVNEYDLKAAIHNHGPGALYDKLDDVLTAVEGRDKRIGACIDTGHFMRSDEDPVVCARKLNDRIHLVHLKDIKIEEDGKKTFTIQGAGDMDMPEFFKTLKTLGYTGPLSLEYEENKDNPLPDMKICIDNIKAALNNI